MLCMACEVFRSCERYFSHLQECSVFCLDRLNHCIVLLLPRSRNINKIHIVFFFSTKEIQIRNWKFLTAMIIEHRNAHENVKRTALYLDEKRSKPHVYLIYYCCPHEKMDKTGILDRQKHWIKTMYGTIICKTALLSRDMKLRVQLMLLTVQIQIR